MTGFVAVFVGARLDQIALVLAGIAIWFVAILIGLRLATLTANRVMPTVSGPTRWWFIYRLAGSQGNPRCVRRCVQLLRAPQPT